MMMTGANAGAGKGDVGNSIPEELITPTDPVDKLTRTAKFPKEKPDPVGPLGMSSREAPLEDVLEKLARPVAPGANVELTIAQLEAERLRLQREARLVVESRQAFDRDMREYNATNGITDGFTPVVPHPRKRADLRNRGKDLNDELARAVRSSSGKATSQRSGTGKPVYNSPAKNLRAAAAARAELTTLTGDAWRKQAERVNELVDVCNRQNEAYRKANPDAGGSRVVVSAKAVSQKSKGQASSPHVRVDRAQSVNSGKSK